MTDAHALQELEKELRERSRHLQVAKETLRAASEAYRTAEHEFNRVCNALTAMRGARPGR